MSQAATASSDAIHASISARAAPPRRFTASGTGMLSTQDQRSGVRPGGVDSTRFLRSATASRVQASPIGT